MLIFGWISFFACISYFLNSSLFILSICNIFSRRIFRSF